MKRNIERFEHAAAGVGGWENLWCSWELCQHSALLWKNMFVINWAFVLRKFRLKSYRVTCTLSIFAVLASIATSIERMATEIRGLQNPSNVK